MAAVRSDLPRLGVLTSHPIQYQAPLFRALAERCDLQVYFAHRATPDNQAEAGFGVGFDWDLDLTAGYPHHYLTNVARSPSLVRFTGCDTPEIADHIARGRYEAFLVFGWHLKSYWQAALACRRLGVPVMARTDSHLEAPRAWLKRRVKEWVYPRLLRRFDLYLPTGTRAAAYLHHYRVPEARIRIVPYCIDVPGFQEGVGQARPARERRRAEWGLAPGELALLFAGKLIPCKRPGDLVAVVQRLRAEGVPAHTVFVGAGPLEGQLRDQAQATGTPAYFAGFKNQSEMPACYAAADLLVLPSDSETWGLTVNEAFACGLPAVVSSAVGCAPDLIEEGLTGAVYAPGDLAGLHRAIRRMAGSKDHPDTQNALVNKTRAYTPGTSATALVEAIRELLSMRNGAKRPQRGTA